MHYFHILVYFEEEFDTLVEDSSPRQVAQDLMNLKLDLIKGDLTG